jgi:predicted DNA-binding ribbon-helix-helix protein
MTGTVARPVKRSFSIRGHRTSISLEEPFWEALKEAATRERMSLAGLIARIDESRGRAGLSSAVRVWILDDVRATRAAVAYDGGNRD